MSLDFCCECGCWIGSTEGSLRQGKDGNAEIICDGCIAIEQLDLVERSTRLSINIGIAKAPIYCSGSSVRLL